MTSLTIGAGGSGVDLMQMREIIAHLPNLNDLILSGCFIVRSRSGRLLPGFGAGLGGRLVGSCGSGMDTLTNIS